MIGSELDNRRNASQNNGVSLYCMTAMVADEASRSGFRDFAKAVESAMAALLSSLPQDEQGKALRLSYEMALGGCDAAPPRLRLVYSRD